MILIMQPWSHTLKCFSHSGGLRRLCTFSKAVFFKVSKKCVCCLARRLSPVCQESPLIHQKLQRPPRQLGQKAIASRPFQQNCTYICHDVHTCYLRLSGTVLLHRDGMLADCISVSVSSFLSCSRPGACELAASPHQWLMARVPAS